MSSAGASREGGEEEGHSGEGEEHLAYGAGRGGEVGWWMVKRKEIAPSTASLL